MSAPCFGWAIDRGRDLALPSSERFVLVVLSNRANGSLVCWPSLPVIASDTGLSPRTVFAAVHALAKRELIEISRRGRGMAYRILRPRDEPQSSHPLQESMPQPSQPVQVSPLNGHGTSQPLQASELRVSQPLQASGDDSCKSCISTLANGESAKSPKTGRTVRVSAKSENRQTTKKEKLERKSDFSNSLLEESKPEPKPTVADMPAPKASKRPSLDGIVLAPEERAMVSLWWRHAEAGDLPKPGLTSRLSYIHQRFPYAGFPWLLQNVPEAAAIAAAQGWGRVHMGASP